jgi:two-component system phosphate regulon sensor histidine kinase PhoR
MKRMILTACSILSAFSIVLTAVLIHVSMYWGLSGRMKSEAAAELEFVRAGIEAAGVAYLYRLDAVPLPENALPPRITLINPDGTVLFDNEYAADQMESHTERPEVQTALAGMTGEDTRFSHTRKKQTYYRARLLQDGSVLRIAVSTDNIILSALALVPVTLAVTLGIFICTLVIASRITLRIVRPINTLNLEIPEENEIYDELSPLLSRIKAQNDQIKKQMAELRKRKLEFEAITDNMREGLLLLDREGRVLSCNQSALKLLHPHAAIAERQSVLTLRRDEQFRFALEKVLGGVPAECSLSVDSFRLRLMASPVADGGKVLGAALLLLDVTEQEDREKLRREFSANVSHELKTPLTVISGYAEILSEGMVKTEDATDFGAKIYHEAMRLLSLINDIMQLSRLDEGAAALAREKVSLSPLVKGVMERASPTAQARNIRLFTENEADETVITGIPQILQEMIFNLVDNGIKYNKDHGEVTVSLRRNKNTIRLQVADTGIGIPPSEQERVFERFYRVDKSRSSSTGGTGLGLSIVKHGAHLHGAEIELESGITGTKITLVFQATV